MLMPVVETVD
jgi:hypothetical protein